MDLGKPQELSGTPMQPVVVWDLPTRVFHILVIVMVLVGWATAEGRGIVFAIHKYNGYALIAALLFRLVWGIAGSRHSRFSDFVRPWREVRDYTLALLRLRPPSYVGHNPLGGWMVLALLATLTLLAVTGLFATGGGGAVAGPFAAVLPQWATRALGDIHEGMFNVLIGLVVIHTLGVLADMLLTGDNLIRAMLTGRKTMPTADARREGSVISPLWGLAIALVSGAAVWLALV